MKNNLTFVFKYTYLCCMKAHKLIFENFSRLSVRGQECDSCAFIPQNPKFEVTLSGVASFFSHILFTHPQQGWLITSSQKQKIVYLHCKFTLTLKNIILWELTINQGQRRAFS